MVIRLRGPFVALITGALAALSQACGDDESGDGFNTGATYSVQSAPTQAPLPPGAGPQDAGRIERDTGVPAPVDAGPDTGRPDAAGPQDAAAGG
jgi:hypothetical protein